MAVLAALAMLDPESKKAIIGAGLGLLNSAPIVALGAALAINLQWNLEHIAIKKTGIAVADNVRGPPYTRVVNSYSFVRLSTKEAADVDHNDPNRTPIAPPLMSSAARLADDGLDVAASAARLAEKQIETVSQKGAIQGVIEFLFGS